MIKANDNFRLLPKSYLFSEVGKRVAQFKNLHPEREIIRMDIGDIKQPLFPCVIHALHAAVDEMGNEKEFHGYGPEQGYFFLRDAIAENDFKRRGIEIGSDEIFISDGAKSDLANLGEIISRDAVVALMNPSYPAYIDDNVIDGRAGIIEKRGDGYYGCRIIYLDCREENGFLPDLPMERPDVIYLCFPNNPTGVGCKRDWLKRWIDYALTMDCLIIYDSAYEAFVRGDDIVKSVYEIEGAKRVAIEVRSFSKTAGFTGIRCGYTIVPKELTGRYADGTEVSMNDLWLRRQTTKFNGASYLSQRGAYALYTEEGQKAIKEATDQYLSNAKLLADSLRQKGFNVVGGVDAPYIWAAAGRSVSSWDLFYLLLENCGITCTPGVGFGSRGEGYIRLTGFNSRGATERAATSIIHHLPL